MVLFLLEKGANVDVRNDEGCTPLHWILYANVWEREIPKYLDVLEVLINFGAEVNVITSKGETLLDLAKKWNARPQFVESLKSNGAK